MADRATDSGPTLHEAGVEQSSERYLYWYQATWTPGLSQRGDVRRNDVRERQRVIASTGDSWRSFGTATTFSIPYGRADDTVDHGGLADSTCTTTHYATRDDGRTSVCCCRTRR